MHGTEDLLVWWEQWHMSPCINVPVTGLGAVGDQKAQGLVCVCGRLLVSIPFLPGPGSSKPGWTVDFDHGPESAAARCQTWTLLCHGWG